MSKLNVNKALGQSSITMRLNPEELGEVKLQLMVEGDRVRAQLHTQSQQVQEVLEKHIATLREGFQQQGLKLEEVEVSYQSQDDGSDNLFREQQERANSSKNFARRGMGADEDDELPDVSLAAQARPLHEGGLSLRV